ncbi:hypothetical protein [Burkholderia sp. MSMB1589WGS]|uniref:hypothetical protein n=1 Tax=Burkholderia sp. MSMB1589WGS TaxID=1636425 RepID=UPI000A557E4B|nr:hypothetical protein [Burkholderia sp. MSMB1589WGS]
MHADTTAYLERFGLPASSALWHRAFHTANGVFDPRYVSGPLPFSHIEPALSQRSRIGKYFDKNFYGRLQITNEPLVLARVVGGRLAGAELTLIDVPRLCALVKPWPELVVKPTLDSGGGDGIRFVEPGNIVATLAQLKRSGVGDLIVQAPIRQCAELAELNADYGQWHRLHKSYVFQGLVQIFPLLSAAALHRNPLEFGGNPRASLRQQPVGLRRGSGRGPSVLREAAPSRWLGQSGFSRRERRARAGRVASSLLGRSAGAFGRDATTTAPPGVMARRRPDQASSSTHFMRPCRPLKPSFAAARLM